MADNIYRFGEVQTELGKLATDLNLEMRASFWEDEDGTKPAESIVSASERFYIKLEWNLTGGLKRHFCGKWRVKVDMESIGEADEYTSECRTIPMDPCSDEWYAATFRLDAGTLGPHPCGTVYLIAVTLSSEDPCGNPGHLWGYARGPSAMFVP